MFEEKRFRRLCGEAGCPSMLGLSLLLFYWDMRENMNKPSTDLKDLTDNSNLDVINSSTEILGPQISPLIQSRWDFFEIAVKDLNRRFGELSIAES